MNFLELVQRARREAGISGSGPTTTVALAGEMLRLADWIRDAYVEIQNSQPYWNWLHKTASIDLVAGGQTYHPVTGWSIYPIRYELDSFHIYENVLGTTDTSFLAFDDYPTARRNYITPQVARPTKFTVLPTREVKFNSVLDTNYNLTFDYYATAEELTNNADTPSMPEQYHLAIVWKALTYYADYEEVPLLRTTATLKFTQIYEQMLRTETPEMTVGAPLA
jgi:hypothetical protein